MKRHIKIITDGSCDLPKEVIEMVNLDNKIAYKER